MFGPPFGSAGTVVAVLDRPVCVMPVAGHPVAEHTHSPYPDREDTVAAAWVSSRFVASAGLTSFGHA
jgi:hypothetical protein